MADFCQKCSVEMFGKDCGDLSGLCKEGDYVWVICEGCKSHKCWPYVLVNHEGRRNRELEAKYTEELAEAATLAEGKTAE